MAETKKIDFDCPPPPDTVVSCAGCAYWKARRRPGTGECRRHTPTAIQDRDGDTWRTWPVTRYDDWCGEYSEEGLA